MGASITKAERGERRPPTMACEHEGAPGASMLGEAIVRP